MPFLVIVVISILVLVAVVGFQRMQQADAAWRRAAEQLEMQFTPSALFAPRTIEGRLHDNRIRVDTKSRSSGEHSTSYTRYRISFPRPLGLGLKLKRSRFLSELAGLFAPEIGVGDERFDRDFSVRGTDAAAVRAFLSPSKRRIIRQLFDEFKELRIDDRGMTLGLSGVAKDPDEIVSVVRGLAFAAARLCAEPADVPVSRVPGSEIESHEPPSPDAPSDQGVEPVETSEAEVNPTTMCEELFSGSVTSTQAGERFDRKYNDRTVRLSGTLRRVTSFSIDFVFGGNAGTKATIELATVGDGSFGKTVQAIVQLPADALGSLSWRSGETIEIEGRLVSCDPAARHLFVADGSVI